MIRIALILSITWTLGPLACLGQDISACLVDLTSLWGELIPETGNIQPGQEVYLNQRYLMRLEQGYYQAPSGEIRCYEYVRPASRKELRKGRIQGSREEVIASDGNIYAPRLISSEVHFFTPSDLFDGQYQGEWDEKVLQLPLGLKPAQVGRLIGLPFRVVKRTSEWLLLDERGTPYVFYLGGPSLKEVFDTQNLQQQLESRQKEARSWIGRSLMVVTPEDTLPDRLGRKNAWLWADDYAVAPSIEQVVKVDREGTTLRMKNRPFPIRIDSNQQWLLYDAGCVHQAREAYLDSLLLVIAKQEFQLEQFVALDPQVWLTNQDLKRHLSGRFGPRRWDEAPRVYQHLGFPQYEATSCLYAEVSPAGELTLVSRFVSDSGLYHTDLMVQIGEDTLRSSRVPTYDPLSTRQYREGQIIEEVRFTSPTDQDIIAAVAQAGNAPVRITCITAGSFRAEVELPQVYRSIIRDAWLYAQLLQAEEQR